MVQHICFNKLKGNIFIVQKKKKRCTLEIHVAANRYYQPLQLH